LAAKFTFRRANQEDVVNLLLRLRPEDAREAEAAGASDIYARLTDDLAKPGDARAMVEVATGRVLAILGAKQTAYGASPWMLCADDVSRARYFTLKHVPRWVRAWGCKWGCLLNASDKRNVMHHRFIEACGFSWLGEASINGHPFRLFSYVHRGRNPGHLRRG
jgi:hypothetical protein